MKRGIVVSAIVLGSAVIAASASADSSSVNDRRGDVRCGHDKGAGRHKAKCSDSMMRNSDIVRATAGHEGTRLKHAIRVVGKFRSIHLLINTEPDSECEWSLFVRRGERPTGAGDCVDGHGVIRHARVDFRSHSVKISFSKGSIGNPASYGWSAYTFLGDWRASTFDHVPKGRLGHYIEHSG